MAIFGWDCSLMVRDTWNIFLPYCFLGMMAGSVVVVVLALFSLLGLLALEVTRGQQFTYSGEVCYSPGIHRQLLHRDVSLRDKLYKMRREYTADTLATFHTESKNVKTFESDTNLHVARFCGKQSRQNLLSRKKKSLCIQVEAWCEYMWRIECVRGCCWVCENVWGLCCCM